MRLIYTTPAHSGSALSPPLFILASPTAPLPHPPERFAAPLPDNLVTSPLHLAQRATALPGRILLWSGWYEPEADAGSLPSSLTWSPAAWSRLTEFCTAAASHFSGPTTSPDARLCFIPRAGHILSDLPSCLRFLHVRTDWAGPHAHRFEILLDPVGMLTQDMLTHAPDHVERIILGLGQAPGVAGILLSNVTVAPDSVTRQPVHQGIIPTRLLSDLLQQHCNPHLPILLLGHNLAAQLEALNLQFSPNA